MQLWVDTMNSHPLSVLLVEDNRELAASVADFLALENISCDHAYNGVAGLNLALEHRYDVILLDIAMPKLDGLGVCEQLRQHGCDTPVLMLTARDTLADKLKGFSAGTDDYLVKPFDLEELCARVFSLASRRSGNSLKLRVGDLQLDLSTKLVTRKGQALKLPLSCWKLLELLMRNHPNVVSRTQLEQVLWSDEPPDSDSLKVHLYNLRRIVDKPFNAKMIHTLPKKGIALKAPHAQN
ncbi:MAG: response regulator transcription factor [Pseudomonadales bacterium]